MEYVTDYDAAMGLAQGDWAKLAPTVIETRDLTQRTADTAVETMTQASSEAKQQILDQLNVTRTLFNQTIVAFDGLKATGRSADSMRAACNDLNSNCEKLETALNEAFGDLDREIVQLGGEVRDVVAQYGQQFAK
ncbi:MAG: hypothetical protein AAFO29_26280, partial [Actinomycetota bacterium]